MRVMGTTGLPPKQGLYDPANEHDACGVGFVANIKGRKSHDIVAQGLQLLINLDHRGAVGADPTVGDGAGCLIQIPDLLLRQWATQAGVRLPQPGHYAVAMCFLPQEAKARDIVVKQFEHFIKVEKQVLLGWRDVPVDITGLGKTVLEQMPLIRQAIVGHGPKMKDQDTFERKILAIRKQTQNPLAQLAKKHKLPSITDFYMPSFSTRTVVYKGLLLAPLVGAFYDDLRNPLTQSAIAMVHQRFSTNTFPSWKLAHPYRFIAHNGEINTVRGNVNWMNARRRTMESELLGPDLDKMWPLIPHGQSDTACLDNALELLLAGGYPLAHAVMMLIPEAWTGNKLMDAKRKAFYEYHAALIEPWDGPAAIAFTDGRQIGATLDRNGLRPARYVVTDDDLVILASEAGVLPIAEEKIVRKWRLQPGKMLLIDLEEGRIVEDDEISRLRKLADAEPCEDWLKGSAVQARRTCRPAGRTAGDGQRSIHLARPPAGIWIHAGRFTILPRTEGATEVMIPSARWDQILLLRCSPPSPSFSTTISSKISRKSPISPIDPIREELVMSLVSMIGPRPNLLRPRSRHAQTPGSGATGSDERRYREDPFDFGIARRGVPATTIDCTWPASEGADGLERAVARICSQATDAVLADNNILILSDRTVCAERIPIPAALASASVHHHLDQGPSDADRLWWKQVKRAKSIISACWRGMARKPSILTWRSRHWSRFARSAVSRRRPMRSENYIKAVGKGVLKVMSKMGISTYQSYCGAQIFDAVGLSSEFIEKYFTGTATTIEGVGLKQIAEESVHRHRDAYGDNPIYQNMLDVGGDYAPHPRRRSRLDAGIGRCRNTVRGNLPEEYRLFAASINEQSERLLTIRGLMRFKFASTAIALDEVQPASEIVKRFATGAMSFGSISREAHTNLAIAMNRIGGRSNTGEGGEEADRFLVPLANGDPCGLRSSRWRRDGLA